MGDVTHEAKCWCAPCQAERIIAWKALSGDALSPAEQAEVRTKALELQRSVEQALARAGAERSAAKIPMMAVGSVVAPWKEALGEKIDRWIVEGVRIDHVTGNDSDTRAPRPHRKDDPHRRRAR